MKFFDIDTFREILDTITRNKSRSILTGFGVFWGVFMLILLAGGGDGLKAMLGKNFEGFASNTLVIAGQSTGKAYKGLRKGRNWTPTMTDVARLKALVPELDVVVPSFSLWGKSVKYGEYSYGATIKCNMPEYAEVETPNLRYGRYINDMDIAQERKVCVLGKRVYASLFPAGGDPTGEYVQIDSMMYKVVGVDMNMGNININGSADRSVIIPLSVARRAYNYGNKVDLICMTVRDDVTVKDVFPKVRDVVYREHTIDPSDDKAMMSVNAQLLFGLVDSLFKGVNFLIWLVGLGTILAGAVGVSNIMMVSVRERTVEIGIRRAIGATPAVILSQIIAESIVLTLFAGLLGIVASVGVLSLMDIAVAASEDFAGMSFQISFKTAMFAVSLLVGLGVLAGLAPSLRAMKIRPVDAMRDE